MGKEYTYQSKWHEHWGGGGVSVMLTSRVIPGLPDSLSLTLTVTKLLYSLNIGGFWITLPIHKFYCFIFFPPILILFEFIQRLGTTQHVTVYCLPDTSLKIVPTNPQVPSEKYYTLPGID